MQIPQSFTDAISQAFYDKTFQTYTLQEAVDDDGWAGISGTSIVSGSFAGNITFNNLDIIQQEYGLKEQIDAMVTTTATIPNETIIGYQGQQYIVYRSLLFDSHNKLMLKQWQTRSMDFLSS